MRHFYKVAEGIDVTPIGLQLTIADDLWDQFTLRKDRDNSPHTGMSDIWVRYNDPEKVNEPDFTEQHFPVWYPSFYRLPALRPLVFALMARVEATHLGGVLFTRIPPGQSIEPHADRGWHPEFYNCKLYVPIASNDRVVNRVEGEHIVMNEGDCWYFRNTVEHEVWNDGPTDRITLILCMRVE